MYLLDTNVLSNYLDKRRANERLRERIQAVPSEAIWISIITYEEILKGVLSLLNRARKHPRNPGKIVEYYALMVTLVRDLSRLQLLPNDAAAEGKYEDLPSGIRQRHPQDSHIAAIALARDYTLITSNTPHFREIPGLRIEDWSV